MKTLFNWSELVTADVLSRLKTLAGLNANAPLGDLDRKVAKALNSLSELPVFAGDLDESKRTALAFQLLERACQHVLREARILRVTSGLLIDTVDAGPLAKELRPTVRVLINIAEVDDLEPLPIIGLALAERIIEERGRAGSFTSIDDLVDRVSGLGEQAKLELRHVFTFVSPVDAESMLTLDQLDFDTIMLRILSLVRRPDPGGRLLAALELIATTCATNPPNVVADQPLLELDETQQLVVFGVDLIGTLENSHYYHELPKLFDEAQNSISIMMFHIALPEPNHPTRQLLDSLVSAHHRGVNVRILVDRDRPTDPYKSTVINGAAKDFLVAAGIDCRFDAEDRLLHSKVVIIDNKVVVIGSHNWSAGSYFQFDDLSFVIASLDYGLAMEDRFQALWQTTSVDD